MTEIVKHETTAASLPQKMEWARTMAASNLLPRQYQQNPGNLLYAVEYAETLGVAPMTAVTGIHVIEGKPSASADLIASLVRRAGHKLRVSGDDTYALAQLIRVDDPDFTYEARWDVAKPARRTCSVRACGSPTRARCSGLARSPRWPAWVPPRPCSG